MDCGSALPRMFFAAVALLCLSQSAAAQRPQTGSHQKWTVAYQETVDVAEIRDASVDPVQRRAGKNQSRRRNAHLRFFALGRDFTLDLTHNSRLISHLRDPKKRRVPSDFFVYRGQLEGVDGSWVRINHHANRISGIIYDGHEFFGVEPAIGPRGGTNQRERTARLRIRVFRLSDTFSTARCSANGRGKRALHPPTGLDKAFDTGSVTMAKAGKQLNIAIVADTDYVIRNSPNPRLAVLQTMNIVEGIYSEQIGVRLNITEIVSLVTNGSLSSSNAGTLLRQFASMSADGSLANPGLAHLFTGRVLNGGSVGISFIGTLCRRNTGVGVSYVTDNGLRSALTVAHEIGHNFGAPHDNQPGSFCASTPGTFLMNPTLNGSDQFSPCSLQAIQNQLNSASCIVDRGVPPVTQTPGKRVFSAGFDIAYGGFSYFDNIFPGSGGDPAYAGGQRLRNGGFRKSALNVVLGGRDNDDVFNMSGGWRRTFNLDESARLSLSLRVSLSHAADYEGDEYSEALVSVDGQSPISLTRLTGDGNGGDEQSTGYQKSVLDLGVLSAGAHTITIGAFSNKKTYFNEITELRIDDVNLVTQ